VLKNPALRISDGELETILCQVHSHSRTIHGGLLLHLGFS
jgi:hypothetical protein